MALYLLVEKHLLEPLKAFSDALSPPGEHLILYFVFDEVPIDGKNTTCAALRRVIRHSQLVSGLGVRVVNKILGQLSARESAKCIWSVSNHLQLSHWISVQIQKLNSSPPPYELSKPLSGYGSKGHLLALGRPLYIPDPVDKIKCSVECGI